LDRIHRCLGNPTKDKWALRSESHPTHSLTNCRSQSASARLTRYRTIENLVTSPIFRLPRGLRVTLAPGEKHLDQYFVGSPFRSVSFVVTSLCVGVFEIWAFRLQGRMDVTHQCASTAVLGIALLPALAWVYALLLRWEIQNLGRMGVDLPPNSRLRQLHQTLVPAVVALSFWLIYSLAVLCRASAL
jgi:hypothetical protein